MKASTPQNQPDGKSKSGYENPEMKETIETILLPRDCVQASSLKLPPSLKLKHPPTTKPQFFKISQTDNTNADTKKERDSLCVKSYLQQSSTEQQNHERRTRKGDKIFLVFDSSGLLFPSSFAFFYLFTLVIGTTSNLSLSSLLIKGPFEAP